ncbi:MAG: hypothetical protein IJL97_02885 [Lachnospiraceae bacterium]|nr:hypothetical protein [Lachnospiraceae bacterium]
MRKQLTTLVLALAIIFGTCSMSAYASIDKTPEADTDIRTTIEVTHEDIEEKTYIGAVTIEELNDESVFIKQSARGRCTVTAAAIIMRRAALILGHEDWDQITESSLAAVTWTWQGIGFTFTLNGITMNHTYISSKEELIELLNDHPEGIVAYDTWYPHAVALLSYDEETDTFWVAEPSEYKPAGIIDMKDSYASIDRVRAAWYVEDPFVKDEIEKTEEIAEEIVRNTFAVEALLGTEE